MVKDGNYLITNYTMAKSNNLNSARTIVKNQLLLGAGCFWGVQAVFELLEGVTGTKTGYTGGSLENPSYEAVCSKNTGHYEVVEVQYDQEVFDARKNIKSFFHIHDPTQTNGQGNDIVPQYLSAIFIEKSTSQVLEYISQIQKDFKLPIATKVYEKTPFYDAEEYHQNYLLKNPTGYCHINMPRVKEFLEINRYQLK